MVRSTITRQANKKIMAVVETRTASAGKFGSEENVIIAVLLKGRLKAMDNLGVAGILQTYAEKARNAKTTEKLREVVRELKTELDLRKIRIEEDDNG